MHRTCTPILTLSQTTNFRLFHSETDDENGRKFYKRVESAAGNGEIARYEQFLLFPQSFQKIFTTDTEKPELVWERVKSTLIPGKILSQKEL